MRKSDSIDMEQMCLEKRIVVVVRSQYMVRRGVRMWRKAMYTPNIRRELVGDSCIGDGL
jgi:hypothetical protein